MADGEEGLSSPAAGLRLMVEREGRIGRGATAFDFDNTGGMGEHRYAMKHLVARGSTSEVWSLSETQVLKLLHSGIPLEWAQLEAETTAKMHSAGLPVPEPAGVVLVEGRAGILLERVAGPSMWDVMRNDPGQIPHLVEQLVELQTLTHQAAPSEGLPEVSERMAAKVRTVRALSSEQLSEVLAVLAELPTQSVACHGDLHPGNLIMSDKRVVMVDWYDAGSGDPLGDFARSSLLMLPTSNPGHNRTHLPAASRELLGLLHSSYVAVLDRLSLVDRERFSAWTATLAVARMAEDVPVSELVSIWSLWADSNDRRRYSSTPESEASGGDGGIRR